MSTEEAVITAYHEAGHALGYWLGGLDFNEITIVRHHDRAGGITVWPPRIITPRQGDLSYGLGPIAEVLCTWTGDWPVGPDDYDDEDCNRQDYLSAVVLWGGGQDDWRERPELFDDHDLVDELFALATGQWVHIERLARALLVHRTMTGADAIAVLNA